MLLARHLVRRGRPLLATLVLPAWWTAFEHLTARLSPHGTFGSLAYTQMELLPIIQIASVCGAAGITYLLMLVASVIAVVTLPTAAPRRRLMLLAIVVVLAAALGFGAWRLAEQRPSTTLQVGLVAADHPAQPATASEAEALTARYAAASATLAEEGADVIVFPETIVRVTAAEAEAVARRFAGGGASAVVAGFALQDDAGERNVALAWDPRSSRLAIYAKQHLLPPFEYRYRPGTQLSLLPLGEGKVTAGLAVCKDLDFPRLGRDYARRGAALLLVPAWDFEVDGWLHSRMAILRGVESGFAVARSARNGRLTLSDDCGRVVAEATSARSDTAVLLAPLAVHARDTLYSRLGDWLGWLCCGVVLLALVALRGHQRRVP